MQWFDCGVCGQVSVEGEERGVHNVRVDLKTIAEEFVKVFDRVRELISCCRLPDIGGVSIFLLLLFLFGIVILRSCEGG